MTKQSVITYQAPNGQSIDLTPSQIDIFESRRTWPKNGWGEEFCTCSHAKHYGEPQVLRVSDGGWSLYARGSIEADIVRGDEPPLYRGDWPRD